MKRVMTIRSQHSVGSSSGFGGPDTYVAVLEIPYGAPVPKQNHPAVLAKHGIRMIYCGEGYSEHRGPKSMLGAAIAKAEAIIDGHK